MTIPVNFRGNWHFLLKKATKTTETYFFENNIVRVVINFIYIDLLVS